jgi:hypothetical protein
MPKKSYLRLCLRPCLPFFASLFSLALLDAGCAPEELPPEPDPFPMDAVHLKIGPIMLAPGSEQTLCVTKLLPTTQAIDVVAIDARQRYTHHVIFYRESIDTPLNEVAEPCPSLDILSANRAPLFIGETPTANMRLPPNVAYRLPAGAPFRIEGHFFNPSPDPVEATGEIILTPARPGATTQEADMIFLNAVTQIDTKSYDGQRNGIPPSRVTTIDPGFWALPDDMLGSKVFGLTSHQHRLGSKFVIYKSTGPMDTGTELYQNTDWEHPPLLLYPDDKPLTFNAGEGFRWLCTYNNTTTSYVKFGQSAQTNEMCILWAYYYPSQGFRVVFQ